MLQARIFGMGAKIGHQYPSHGGPPGLAPRSQERRDGEGGLEGPGWFCARRGGKSETFICGPPIMLKYTIPELTKLEFAPENTFLSFEMRMKCGIGKCGRCNIGPKYVCIDGPVFSLAQVNTLPNEY